MSHLFYICVWSYIVWRFGKLGFLVSYSEAQSSDFGGSRVPEPSARVDLRSLIGLIQVQGEQSIYNYCCVIWEIWN